MVIFCASSQFLGKLVGDNPAAGTLSVMLLWDMLIVLLTLSETCPSGTLGSQIGEHIKVADICSECSSECKAGDH